MGESFRHGPIIKVGRLALYNFLSQSVVDARSTTLGILKSVDPDQFEEMIKTPVPIFGYGESSRGESK
jgi:restriction endonuclease Mrr